MAGGAGLPAPFACSGRRRRRRNHGRRRRLKHPCQPIVFCQLLRQVLRRCGVGQTDGDEQCGNTTKDWRGNSHEQRSRLPVRSICSCPMGHLLCYRVAKTLGSPRTINQRLRVSFPLLRSRIAYARQRCSQGNWMRRSFAGRIRASSPIGQRFRRQSVADSISLPC
jgi:hypothetical protein